MRKAYSVDLRECVLAYMGDNGSNEEACLIFGVSRDTIYRWLRQQKIEGHVRPKARGKYKTRKLEDAKLQAYVKSHVDATLIEMASEFNVSHVAIWKALRRLKITRKKKPFVSGTG